MILRQGFKFVFRDRKSLLFFLLAFLSVTLITASVCTCVALDSALSACKNSYITIGTVEYTAGGYPNDSYVNEDVAAAAEGFDPEIKNGAISYEKSKNAFGIIDGMTGFIKEDRSRNKAVFVIKVIGKSETEWDASWICRVERVLFYRRDMKELMVKVHFNDITPKKGEYYAVNCNELNDGSAYAEFEVCSFSDPSLPTCENITNGTTYSLPETSNFYTYANYCRFLKGRLRVNASDEPKALYPFQQGFISLVDGAFYNSRGCVVSKRIAKQANLAVGDTLKLNTVARRGLSDFYFDAFDASAELTVSGIFDGDEEYADCVFIPVLDGIKTETLSFTIGQLRLENGRGEEYLESLALPENIRVTLFDQGYGRASASLNDMAMLVFSVCRICLVAGLAFLLLTAFLTVSNQKKAAGIMTRLGVTRLKIHLYYTVCAASVALPAAVPAAVCAQAVCTLAVKMMAENITVGESTLDYFVRDTYMAKISLSEMFAPPAVLYSALISFGAFLCIAALSVLFVAIMSRKKRARGEKINAKRKSRSLKGGACKYALLSISRGGRTAVSLAAAVGGLVLILFLSSSLSGYRQSFADLQKDSTVSAYFTDSYGQKSDGLVIDRHIADTVKGIDGISNVNAGNSLAYQVESVGESVYNPDRGSMSSFTFEAYLSYVKSGARLVFTDDLLSSPEFLTAKNASVTYLDGYDESIFSQKENRGLCVIPKQIQESYDVEPGDIISLRAVLDIGESNQIVTMPYKVVGVFSSDNGDCNIYSPASAIIRDDKMAIGGYYGYRGAVARARQIEENGEVRRVYDIVCMNTDAAYSFLSFTVNSCENLEAVKTALYDAGFSEVRTERKMRSYIVFNDSGYLMSFRAAKQRLWYMEHLFPVIYALALILAAAVPFVMASMRKNEMKIMHSLGQKKSSVFASLFVEQLIICLACIAVFIPVALLIGKDCIYLTVSFVALWLTGSAVGTAVKLK